MPKSLKAIGKNLGNFVKISNNTLRGKYTSFAWICVEMDLSRELLDAIILEVYEKEWVQMVDYEHIPFRYRKCHEHGHLYRDYPLNKLDSNTKATTNNDPEGFTKVGGEGKGGKRYQKKSTEDGKPNHNSFKILEEEVENNWTNQESKNIPNEKEGDANMEDILEKKINR